MALIIDGTPGAARPGQGDLFRSDVSPADQAMMNRADQGTSGRIDGNLQRHRMTNESAASRGVAYPYRESAAGAPIPPSFDRYGSGAGVSANNIGTLVDLNRQILDYTKREYGVQERMARSLGSAPHVPNFSSMGSWGGGPPTVPNFSNTGGPGRSLPIVPNFTPSNGGGGGGGGGGSGGGGRGAGRFPSFRGGLASGFMNSLPTPVRWGAELIGAVALAPQEAAALVGSVYSADKEAIEFNRGTGSMAIGSGLDPNDTRRRMGMSGSFQDDFLNPPKWMRTLGMGPNDVRKAIGTFGIAPRSADDIEGIGSGIGGLKFYGAFGGMPEGQVERSAAQSASYGLISGDAKGIEMFMRNIEPVFARATEQGVNKSNLMKAMDQWAASSIGGYRSQSKEAVGNFLLDRSMLMGGPEAGLQAIKGLNSAGATVGTDAFRTINATAALSGVKSEKDLRSLIDSKQPGLYARIQADPVMKRQYDAVVESLNHGDRYNFVKGVTDLAENNPELQEYLLTGGGLATSAGVGYGRDRAGAYATGQSMPQYYAGQVGKTEKALMPKQQALIERLMRDMGISREAAIGMVGILSHESGLNPEATNRTSGAYGYAQWLDTNHSPRKTQFLKYIADHPGLSHEEANIRYLEQDVSKNFPGLLSRLRQSGRSAHEYGYDFLDTFERPAKEAYPAEMASVDRLNGRMQRVGSDPADPGQAIRGDPTLEQSNDITSRALTTSMASSQLSLRESMLVLEAAARLLAAKAKAVAENPGMSTTGLDPNNANDSASWYHRIPSAAALDSFY